MQFHYEYFDVLPEGEEGYATIISDTLVELRENDLRFKGNVCLLTSFFTYSSAASFSWAFKFFDMGTVIGEETGGISVTFGEMIYQKLPHTELMLSVSSKKFYHYGASDERIHGTLPDIEVPAEKAPAFAVDFILKRQR